MNFRVVPIAADTVHEAREKLVSPQYKSLTASVGLATGYGPCRSCLRVFDVGNEDRIYITYNSFEGVADLPDPGPIFIHRENCKHFEEHEFPADLLELPLLLEAFGENCWLIGREKMSPQTVSEQIATIFADERVQFINLRNAEAGCFVARVERGDRAA